MKRLLLILPLILFAAGAQASAIVDAPQLREALARGAVLWDVRGPADFAKGHIAGAVNIGDAARVLRNENSEDFIATAEIEKLLGGAGIDPRKEVIVYGGWASPTAYFGLYTLQYFGATKAAVFHDGIDGWREAGLPLATQAARPVPVALKLEPLPAVAVSTAEVLARLGKPGVQFVDVRTPREYSGDDIRAIRGGHIPGSVNIPYEQNWVDPEAPAKLARRQAANTAGLALKPKEQLKRLYGKLDPDKETIVYCQSGVRAAQTATVLAELGFKKVRVYDSSWLAYGNNLDAPAESVQFFNVGLLNGRMAGMAARIEALERELAEARAARK